MKIPSFYLLRRTGTTENDRMAVLAFVAGVAFYFFHRKIDQEHDELMRLQEGTLPSTKKTRGHRDSEDDKPIIIHSDVENHHK
jgi:hypothetical protein